MEVQRDAKLWERAEVERQRRYAEEMLALARGEAPLVALYEVAVAHAERALALLERDPAPRSARPPPGVARRVPLTVWGQRGLLPLSSLARRLPPPGLSLPAFRPREDPARRHSGQHARLTEAASRAILQP